MAEAKDNNGEQESTSPVSLAPGQFFSPSRGIAPELAAALKEAVEQQAAYEEEETAGDDDIDIGGTENAGVDDDGAVPAVVADTKTPADAVGASYLVAAAGTPLKLEQEEEPESEPEPEPVPDQPFVRKAQGKWLSVESSSDEDDYCGDDDTAMEEAETALEEDEASATLSGGESMVTAEPVDNSASDSSSAAITAAVSSEDACPTNTSTFVSKENNQDSTVAAAVEAKPVIAQDVIPAQPTVATATSAMTVTPTAMDVEPELSPPVPPVPPAPRPKAPEVGSELPKVEPTLQHPEQETSQPDTSPPTELKGPRRTPGVEIVSMPVDLEGWRERVRRAETTEDLANLGFELDYAIPREEGWLEPWYKTESFVEPRLGGGSSLAAAATRVFALDRALRWNIIPRPRHGGSRFPGDLPRAWPFFYQCPASPLCTRPGLHKGKCKPHRSGISRVDHPMVIPAPPYTPPYAAQQATAYAVASHAYGTAPAQAPAPSPAAAQAYSHQLFSANAPAQSTGAAIAVLAGSTTVSGSGGGAYAVQARQQYAITPPAPSYLTQVQPPTTAAVTPSAAAPQSSFHHATPVPTKSATDAVAAAPANSGAGDGSNAGVAHPAAIVPTPIGVAPTGATPSIVIPGLTLTPGLWFPGLSKQPTAEDMQRFKATTEAAARDAWAAAACVPGQAQTQPTAAVLAAAHRAAWVASTAAVSRAAAAAAAQVTAVTQAQVLQTTQGVYATQVAQTAPLVHATNAVQPIQAVQPQAVETTNAVPLTQPAHATHAMPPSASTVALQTVQPTRMVLATQPFHITNAVQPAVRAAQVMHDTESVQIVEATQSVPPIASLTGPPPRVQQLASSVARPAGITSPVAGVGYPPSSTVGTVTSQIGGAGAAAGSMETYPATATTPPQP